MRQRLSRKPVMRSRYTARLLPLIRLRVTVRSAVHAVPGGSLRVRIARRVAHGRTQLVAQADRTGRNPRMLLVLMARPHGVAAHAAVVVAVAAGRIASATARAFRMASAVRTASAMVTEVAGVSAVGVEVTGVVAQAGGVIRSLLQPRRQCGRFIRVRLSRRVGQVSQDCLARSGDFSRASWVAGLPSLQLSRRMLLPAARPDRTSAVGRIVRRVAAGMVSAASAVVVEAAVVAAAVVTAVIVEVAEVVRAPGRHHRGLVHRMLPDLVRLVPASLLRVIPAARTDLSLCSEWT